MEMLVESGMISPAKLKDLMAETNEIPAMIVAEIKTLRSRKWIENSSSSSIQNQKYDMLRT